MSEELRKDLEKISHEENIKKIKSFVGKYFLKYSDVDKDFLTIYCCHSIDEKNGVLITTSFNYFKKNENFFIICDDPHFLYSYEHPGHDSYKKINRKQFEKHYNIVMNKVINQVKINNK